MNITNGTYDRTGSPWTGEYTYLYVKANPQQTGLSRHERKGKSDGTIRNRPTLERQNRIQATKAGSGAAISGTMWIQEITTTCPVWVDITTIWELMTAANTHIIDVTNRS
jgi:hypothetical protein